MSYNPKFDAAISILSHLRMIEQGAQPGMFGDSIGERGRNLTPIENKTKEVALHAIQKYLLDGGDNDEQSHSFLEAFFGKSAAPAPSPQKHEQPPTGDAAQYCICPNCNGTGEQSVKEQQPKPATKESRTEESASEAESGIAGATEET